MYCCIWSAACLNAFLHDGMRKCGSGRPDLFSMPSLMARSLGWECDSSCWPLGSNCMKHCRVTDMAGNRKAVLKSSLVAQLEVVSLAFGIDDSDFSIHIVSHRHVSTYWCSGSRVVMVGTAKMVKSFLKNCKRFRTPPEKANTRVFLHLK